MKYLKKVLLINLILSVLILSVGCSKNTKKEVDIEGFKNEILASDIFRETLNKLDNDTANIIYSLDDDSIEKDIYISSGATADEFAIFTLNNSDNNLSKTIEEAISTRLEYQIDGFEDYVPEELSILKNAFSKQYDNYYIFIVSNNDNYLDIVNKYFK